MKIKGNPLVNPLMLEMTEGQKGYLDANAIIIEGNNVFVDTTYCVSAEKKEEYSLPITRTGPWKEDFEIDFNIINCFDQGILKEKNKEEIKNDINILGPYPIKTENHKPLQYREQMYPRMDWLELVNALLDANETLECISDDQVSIKNKVELKKCFKNKIDELDLLELEIRKSSFSQPTPKELEIGRINILADKELFDYMNTKIQILQAKEKGKKTQDQIKLKDLSLDELEILKKQALEEEEFEYMGKIEEAINYKKNIINQTQ